MCSLFFVLQKYNIFIVSQKRGPFFIIVYGHVFLLVAYGFYRMDAGNEHSGHDQHDDGYEDYSCI